MTHHIVHVTRITGGWSFTIDGLAVVAPRLCDVEPAVRLHLQRSFGASVADDTVEVKLGGRTPTSPMPSALPLIDTRGHKRGKVGRHPVEHGLNRKHR